MTCGRRRYDLGEYWFPNNRYYCPPHETSTSPLCQVPRAWRGHSSSRSRSRSPQLRCPPSPQVSSPPGTLLDRYPELDPRGDEAVAAAEPLPGPSMDPSYDGDNSEKLDMDSHLWREECFHEAEENLDRGITTLTMNLATLVTNMDDLMDLADSMHLPRRIATLPVTTYKPVMVTMLQLYTSCNYHMLVVWYWSETGDEFKKLYNLQKIFVFLGLGSKCVGIMSCHVYGPVDTGMRNLL